MINYIIYNMRINLNRDHDIKDNSTTNGQQVNKDEQNDRLLVFCYLKGFNVRVLNVIRHSRFLLNMVMMLNDKAHLQKWIATKLPSDVAFI